MELFDNKQLVQIFSKQGKAAPEKIKEALIKNLEGYTCTDDVTFLIIKQLSPMMH